MKFIIALTMVLLAFGCDKKSDSQPVARVNQYGMRDGTCFDYTNNTYVSNNLCTNYGGNGGYGYDDGNGQGFKWVNGACYNRDGYQVSTDYCNGYNNGGGGYYGGGYQQGAAKVCYGQYIYNGGGYPQYGMCYGANCRGYTLIEVATGQMVSCM